MTRLKTLKLSMISLVLFLFIMSGLFFLKPGITGLTVLEQNLTHITAQDNLSFSADSDMTYVWVPSEKGNLNSVSLSGYFEGDSFKVSLGDNLIYSYFSETDLKLAEKITESSGEINLNFNYGNELGYDNNNDGITFNSNVIDFVVDTIFNFDVNYDKLCTKYNVDNINDNLSYGVCYGSLDCCNFLNLELTSNIWNETFYLNYGKYGSSYNNTVTAQVVYYDVSFNESDLYSNIYNSESLKLDAKFTNGISFNSNELILNLKQDSYDLDIIVDGNLVLSNIKYSLGLNKTITVEDEYLRQYNAVVGQDVRWVKKVKYNSAATNLSINITNNAKNIQINKIVNDEIIKVKKNRIKIRDKDGLKSLQDFENSKTSKKGSFSVSSVEEEEETNTTEIIIEDSVDEVNIEYYTEAPKLEETQIDSNKRKIIVSSNVHYTDILAFTNISPEAKASSINLYRTTDGIREKVLISMNDTNNNSLIDYISWIVPSLSNQTYELEIIVLNVQSYPTVGGNWTVLFNTSGTGNLTIKAINGTTWNNTNETEDLLFLEVKCGTDVKSYSWINEIVFIENYSCDNQTGYETSKVIRAGAHNLMFQFGNQTAYANNFASINGNNSNLSIWDSSDNTTMYANYTKFYANYTNLSGSLINSSGSYCQFTYNKTGLTWSQYTPINLTFNSSTDLYEIIADGSYLAGHTSNMPIGNYSFNVSCSNNLGYSNLSTTDTLVISEYNTTLSIENETGKSVGETVMFYANYSSVLMPVSGVGLNNYEIGAVVWKKYDLGDSAGGAKFFDYNNDGFKNELIVTTDWDGGLDIFVYYKNGTLISNFGGISIAKDLAVGDLDNDGYENEFVVMRSIVAYNESLDSLWSFGSSYQLDIALGDINLDGWMDVLFEIDGGNISAVNATGEVLFNKNYTSGLAPSSREIILGDVISDFGLEIIINEFNYGNGLYLINSTGDTKWNTPFDNGLTISFIDANNDGTITDTILTTQLTNVRLYNATDGNNLYNFNPGASTSILEYLVADFDNDGYEDDAVFMSGGIVFLYSFNTTSYNQIWNYSLSQVLSSNNLMRKDINNNGNKEIIVHTESNLLILNESGSLLFKYNYLNSGTTGNAKNPGIDTTDVNNDGIPDFAVAVASTLGDVYILQEVKCIANFNDSNSYNMTWNNTLRKWELNRTFSSSGDYDWNVTCNKGGYVNQVGSDSIAITSDISSPSISLNTPLNNTETLLFNISFNFTTTDISGIQNATLYANFFGTWQANETNQTSLTSGQSAIINVSDIQEGSFVWNIYSCDTNDNCGFTIANYTLIVDRTNPIVNLIAPANNSEETVSKIFTYNVSDANNVSNCSLIINGDINQTDFSITKDLNQTFTSIIDNGNYNWSVNCSDQARNVGNSAIFNVTLNIPNNSPSVSLVNPSNGSTDTDGNVTFTCNATDDNALVNISLYHNISGTWQLNQTTNISGTQNSSSWAINNIPYGTYIWNCLAYDDAGQNSWNNTNYTIIIDDTIYINSCQQITESGYYKLTNNVTSSKTCFSVSTGKVVIDLNGYTVNYANLSTPFVYNSDFELGSGGVAAGWNFSNATNITRFNGSYYDVNLYSGNYSLKFSLPSSNQYIRTNETMYLEGNTTYLLMGVTLSTNDNNASIYIALINESEDIIQGTSGFFSGGNSPCSTAYTQIKTSRVGQCYRGNCIIYKSFYVNSSMNVYLEVGIEGNETNTTTDTMYIDDVKVVPAYNYGIVKPSNYCSFVYPNLTLDLETHNLTIKNGFIKQSNKDGAFSHAIVIKRSNNTVSNITSWVYGLESSNLMTTEDSYFDNSEIYENTFYNNASYVRVRDWGTETIKVLGPNVNIYNNSLIGSPQYGIRASSNSDGLTICNNYIRITSIVTQGFAIGAYADNIIVCNNTIIMDNGRGIHVTGVNITVYGNSINVSEGKNQEYTGMTSYGIQFEGSSSLNAMVYNNIVTAKTHPNNGNAVGLRFTDITPNSGHRIFNNTIIAVKNHSTSAYAIYPYVSNGEGVTIENNLFISNNIFIISYNANNFEFLSNTFRRGDNPQDISIISFSNFPVTATSKNYSFVNATLENVSFNDFYFNPIWGIESDFEVKWFLDINVNDSSGYLENATVNIYDVNSNLVLTQNTTSLGLVNTNLSEFRQNITDKIYYTNYIINLSKEGYISQSQSINLTNSSSIYIILNATVDITPPNISLISPANTSTWTSSSTVTFNYNVTDSSNIANCSLLIDNAIDQTDTTVTKDTAQTFTKTLANNNYNWSVNCYDSSSNLGNSSVYNLTVSYTAPPGGSSGGGGGGGSSATATPVTLITSETVYTVVRNDVLSFSSSDGVSHTLTVSKVGTGTVSFIFQSDPIKFSLIVDEEKTFDIENKEQFYIKLISIIDRKADIVLKKIIPKPTVFFTPLPKVAEEPKQTVIENITEEPVIIPEVIKEELSPVKEKRKTNISMTITSIILVISLIGYFAHLEFVHIKKAKRKIKKK